MSFFRKRVLLWPTLLVIIALAAGGVFLAPVAMQAASAASLFGVSTETRNTQVINSITKQEQIVLLSLGIQGIYEKNQRGDFLGAEIPGSERASFLQYNFDAKLGIEGGDVMIEQTGEDHFLISIPETIFIGHNNESFTMVAENNGALSWVTPEIDSVEMINEILDDSTQAEYIEKHKALVEEQAKAFYTGIITSIDPEIVVEFEFSS